MPARYNLGAKDFELIAAVVHDAIHISSVSRTDLAFDFAERLLATSDSFDPVRFVSAATCEDYSPEIVGAVSTALRLRVEAQEARRRPR